MTRRSLPRWCLRGRDDPGLQQSCLTMPTKRGGAASAVAGCFGWPA